jgi:tetratricopeptide (TPR) repeat protein
MSTINQLHHQAQSAINRRDYHAAHALCVQIVKLNPAHADSYFLLGIINSEVGQIHKAIKLIEKAIFYAPNPEYFAYLAKCLSLKGDMGNALIAIERAPVEQIKSASTLDTLGVALSRVGHHERAIGYFEKALKIQNDNPFYFYNFGVSCKFAGRFAVAQQAFEKAIALKPDYYPAHFALSDLGKVSPQRNNIARLNALIDTQPDSEGGLLLGHAIAKEYEALGEYSNAFAELIQAKKNRLADRPYDFSEDKSLFDVIGKTSKLQEIVHKASIGCQSKRPIFIVGMPRSGTTLVERIISNHSAVVSGGELQDFGVALKELTQTPSAKVLDTETLEAATRVDFRQLGERYIERTNIVGPNAPHFVDKLPFNFYYVHLIRRALPNAKIICMLRNPMDTCVGNFRQLFTINSPYYAYSFNLLTIGYFYKEFYNLATSWKKAEDKNIMVLNYEELASNPTTKIPQLIDFCGLNWQEQCLHAERNTAPVSTASKVQVREPINTSSIGRWERYKPHTTELEKYLTEQHIPY